MKDERFILPSIDNARELGGIILPEGRVKSGVLLRGGALCTASDADIKAMHEEYNVVRVFDFRTEGEVQRAPDRDIEGSVRIWLPAIDPETEKVAGQSLPREAYLNLPVWLMANSSNPMVQKVAAGLYNEMVLNEYTQLQYAAFLSQVVNAPDGALYWHCSQGKDRTGLGAAFILYALGADRETVMNDYMISADFYADLFEPLSAKLATEAEREVLRTFVSVNPRYFISALDLIDRRFGSMAEYLRGPLCLTAGDIEVLKEKYLERC